MVYAGMIEVLAESTADLAGGAWPVFAPSVGMLGTFITGSYQFSRFIVQGGVVSEEKP
jgi:lactate permease